MTLSVSFRHRFPDVALDVTFESSGRLIALFGPSGCGKTSVVNVIAGLLRPDSGRIALGGDVFADTAAGTWKPPHRRRIGYVFQDARLLPHLSVKQNLRYGRWFTPADERYADEAGVVNLLGLSALLERRPAHLSGGERQRVAIGRALLQSPHLLLMDEPLASLDEARKLEILPYIERLRDEAKVPIVYVSHGVSEVTRLATDVVRWRRAASCGPDRCRRCFRNSLRRAVSLGRMRACCSMPASRPMMRRTISPRFRLPRGISGLPGRMSRQAATTGCMSAPPM